ncbi:MAG: hypothetical protein AB7K09_18535 [Planctomycetota bacterium]
MALFDVEREYLSHLARKVCDEVRSWLQGIREHVGEIATKGAWLDRCLVTGERTWPDTLRTIAEVTQQWIGQQLEKTDRFASSPWASLTLLHVVGRPCRFPRHNGRGLWRSDPVNAALHPDRRAGHAFDTRYVVTAGLMWDACLDSIDGAILQSTDCLRSAMRQNRWYRAVLIRHMMATRLKRVTTLLGEKQRRAGTALGLILDMAEELSPAGLPDSVASLLAASGARLTQMEKQHADWIANGTPLNEELATGYLELYLFLQHGLLDGVHIPPAVNVSTATRAAAADPVGDSGSSSPVGVLPTPGPRSSQASGAAVDDPAPDRPFPLVAATFADCAIAPGTDDLGRPIVHIRVGNGRWQVAQASAAVCRVLEAWTRSNCQPDFHAPQFLKDDPGRFRKWFATYFKVAAPGEPLQSGDAKGWYLARWRTGRPGESRSRSARLQYMPADKLDYVDRSAPDEEDGDDCGDDD